MKLKWSKKQLKNVLTPARMRGKNVPREVGTLLILCLSIWDQPCVTETQLLVNIHTHTHTRTGMHLCVGQEIPLTTMVARKNTKKKGQR